MFAHTDPTINTAKSHDKQTRHVRLNHFCIKNGFAFVESTSAVARSLIKAMETRFLHTRRLQPSGVIDKNNFWSSVADLRRLGGRVQVKIRAPWRHISTSISPWGACSLIAECLCSLGLSVFMGTLLPGYFYHICASLMLKFGPSCCTSPAWSSSLGRICWVIGIASIEKTVLPHFLNRAERIPTSGEISQHNTRFEQTEQLKTW